MSEVIPVVVSLTSWKKRIDTCHLTIKSILEHSNPYKIVLVLSMEEFPNREADLPASLLEYKDSLDIIWIKQNPKAFKKVLFALNKYRGMPVISADDDCLYQEDYVKILYDKWLTDKTAIWTYKRNTDVKAFYFGHGPACLYPPYCFKEYGLRMLTKEIVDTNHDDIYYGVLAKFMCIKVKQALDDNEHVPYVFHDETEPLHDSEMNGCKCISICVNSMMQCITRVPEEVLIN